MMTLASGIFPCVVQYCDLPDKIVDGKTFKRAGQTVKFLPWVKIIPGYVDDVGLHEHEFKHIEQYYVGVGLCLVMALAASIILFLPLLASLGVGMIAGVLSHGLLNAYARWYRLRCEVAAYREQIKHYREDTLQQRTGREDLFAWFIADGYGLDISQPEALAKLRA